MRLRDLAARADYAEMRGSLREVYEALAPSCEPKITKLTFRDNRVGSPLTIFLTRRSRGMQNRLWPLDVPRRYEVAYAFSTAEEIRTPGQVEPGEAILYSPCHGRGVRFRAGYACRLVEVQWSL